MGRKAVYSSGAERQKAYRQRVALTRLEPTPTVSVRKIKQRRVSRPARLRNIEAEAEDLLSEYQEWAESLPESLRDTDQGVRLLETIERLELVLQTLMEIDPPLGFGRD